MPSVSVIVPVRNGEHFLHSALLTIAMQEMEVEVIAIDDKSEDCSREILEQFPLPIQILNGAGEGPAVARNLGLEKAQGEVIAFLDADDLWPAGKLKRQLQRLEEGFEIVSGRIVYFEEEEHLAPKVGSRQEWVYFMQLGGALFRRSLFEQIGHFDPDQRYGEDLDLFFRAMEHKAAITLLAEPTLYYRKHADSMTAEHTEREKLDFKKVIHKSIIRRRRKGIGELPKFESYAEEACAAL